MYILYNILLESFACNDIDTSLKSIANICANTFLKKYCPYIFTNSFTDTSVNINTS